MAGTRSLSDAKRRLLDELKRRSPATVPSLADALSLTTAAVRQHLSELEGHGLVEQRGDQVQSETRGRGRPAATWALTPLAQELFPDRHADLTVDLLDAVRRSLGEQGLERVIDVRRRDQLEAYRAVLPAPTAPLGERVKALARQRTAEGYMAEAVADDDGSWLLVEHHCPIRDAAVACSGLCRVELEVFRAVLGRDVSVDREHHLLAGDARCAYRVKARAAVSRTR